MPFRPMRTFKTPSLPAVNFRILIALPALAILLSTASSYADQPQPAGTPGTASSSALSAPSLPLAHDSSGKVPGSSATPQSAVVQKPVPAPTRAWPTDRDIAASSMSAMSSVYINGAKNEVSATKNEVNLLDGRPETLWCANGEVPNPSITLNLGSTVFATPPVQPVTISALRVLNASNSYFPKEYDIYVSSDSTNGSDGTWTQVAAGKWVPQKTASGGDEVRAWFHPVAAKYLRLNIIGRNWFKISEIRVERASDSSIAFPEIQRPNVTVDAAAPAPADVEAQARRFAQRNSPEQVKKLATEFFGWIDLDHPDMTEVKKLYGAGDYDGALRAYRAFFLRQMRDTTPHWNILGNVDFWHTLNTDDGTLPDNIADQQMFNITTIDNPKPRKKVDLGEPGRINWSFDKQMLWQEQFYPLQYAYLEKGDPRFLAKWAEFADDWALNQHDPRSAVDLGYGGEPNGSMSIIDLFKHFSWLAYALPEDGTGLSETTLARLLLLTLREYPPMGVLYSRSNPQNWQTGNGPNMLGMGIELERTHFKCRQFFMQEGIRAEAQYNTHCGYLDGTETQRDIWYNQMYVNDGVVPLLDQLQALQPNLLTPDWDVFFRDSARARHAYRVRIMYPSGQLPQVLRNEGYVQIPKPFYDLLPWHNDPELPVLMDLYAANQDKKEPTAFPSFTSDAYPYGGYYLIRQGWRLTDQQGTFFNSGRPSVGFRQFADNKFALHAFGEDLISAGEVGAYSQIPSPLTVDGRFQQNSYSFVTFGHKLLTPPLSDSPNPYRWHNSERYDLVEGIYDGAYNSSERTTLDLASANKTLIKDVTYQRWVQFLRRHGLWIVTDRIASPATHAYTQNWDFVVPADQVHCDPQQQTVEAKVEKAAVKLQQFTHDSLNYEVKTKNGNFSYNGKKMPSYSYANISFSGPGAHAVITAIFPHLAGDPELRDVQKLTPDKDTIGFSATTPDGTKVRYLTHLSGTGTLALDPVTVTGESLLLVTEPDGKVSGLVLGCNALAIGGVKQRVDSADAEFSLVGARLTDVQPIYRPIEPVVIEPEANVFIDHLAVSLSCSTPGTKIHYTTDGSDPTLASPLYSAPFTLTASATVKARAFRDGVTREPSVMSGTLASSITSAPFMAEKLQPATAATVSKAGLNFEYYEGSWKTMLLALDTLQPLKKGEVADLFDIAHRQTEEPFSFRYTGYLNVPADGVYTLYFPDEFCRMDLISGYDIKFKIDGQQYQPEVRRHAHGTVSMPLAKGLHTLAVDYLDYRGQDASIRMGFPSDKNAKVLTLRFDRTGTVTGKARMNFPDLNPERNLVWDGVSPKMEISGPGIPRQPLQKEWLWHTQSTVSKGEQQ